MQHFSLALLKAVVEYACEIHEAGKGGMARPPGVASVASGHECGKVRDWALHVLLCYAEGHGTVELLLARAALEPMVHA